MSDHPLALALFGSPVAHSLSPRIHSRFGEQTGIALEYTAIDIGRDGFPARLQAFAEAGGHGCNITLPLKDEAWRLASHRGRAATRAGAANTLVAHADGWWAHNTDGRGLVHDLRRHGGVGGRTVLVLGAGGAAAGILGDLIEAGTSRLSLANRTRARAEHLAERHVDLDSVHVLDWEAVTRTPAPDLVINATAMGHDAGRPPLPRIRAGSTAMVYDLNYGRAGRPLGEAASAAGYQYQDGLGMLVEQAALAFHLWTGHRPETGPVLDQLRRASAPA